MKIPILKEAEFNRESNQFFAFFDNKKCYARPWNVDVNNFKCLLFKISHTVYKHYKIQIEKYISNCQKCPYKK